MELKVCEKCKSISTSEDLLTNEITCLSCGHVSKGEKVEFYGVKENEKIIKHSPRFQPFQIQQKIKRFNPSGLL